MKDKVTIHTLKTLKNAGQKICMVTAYDATFARILDEAGADVLLVGDSLGMVVQGHDSTLPVTMDEMVYHCRAVARGAKRAHVVGDMPFMSYQISAEEAVRNAGRLVAEGGVGAVKLEGGEEFAETIATHRARVGIPVMGHVGLTPQSVHKMGGYVVQGTDEETARKLLERRARARGGRLLRARARGHAAGARRADHRAPRDPHHRHRRRACTATARCSSATTCSGMNPDFKPKFVKRYANLFGDIKRRERGVLRRGPRGRVPRRGPLVQVEVGAPRRLQPAPEAAARPRARRRARGEDRPVRRAGLGHGRAHPPHRGRGPPVRPRRRAGTASASPLVPTMGYLHEGHLSLIREGQAARGPRASPRSS